MSFMVSKYVLYYSLKPDETTHDVYNSLSRSFNII